MNNLLKDLQKFLVDKDMTTATSIFKGDKKYKHDGKDWSVTEDLASKYSEYVDDSTLVIITEGLLYSILNYDSSSYLYTEFQEIFHNHGYYYEMATSWCLQAVPE